VVLRRDLLLGLHVQRVTLRLLLGKRDQGVLRVTDLSSSAGAEAVQHAEVKRANELQVRTWQLVFSSLDTIGELGSWSASGHPLWVNSVPNGGMP
jgi:hypothetical protein